MREIAKNMLHVQYCQKHVYFYAHTCAKFLLRKRDDRRRNNARPTAKN